MTCVNSSPLGTWGAFCWWREMQHWQHEPTPALKAHWSLQLHISCNKTEDISMGVFQEKHTVIPLTHTLYLYRLCTWGVGTGIHGCLPSNKLLCSTSAHLHQGGLLLCCQIHRLLWVQVRPQRRFIILQLVLPWLQCVFKRLQGKSKNQRDNYVSHRAILVKFYPSTKTTHTQSLTSLLMFRLILQTFQTPIALH